MKVAAPPEDGKITALEFHPDGLLLISGHEKGALNIWDVRSSKLVKKLQPYKDSAVMSVTFSNRGILFACAAASSANPVKIFDMIKQFAETEIPIQGASDSGEQSSENVPAISFDTVGNYLFIGVNQGLFIHAGKKWTEVQGAFESQKDGMTQKWSFSKNSFMAISTKSDNTICEYTIKNQ